MGRKYRNFSIIAIGDGVPTATQYVSITKEGLSYGEAHPRACVRREDDRWRSADAYMSVTGIDRAAPKPMYAFCNKPPVEEDPLSKPRTIPEPGNRPQFGLRVDDIPGTRPTAVGKVAKPRGTNPLEPHYQLPTTVERPFTPPRFLRDAMDLTDVPGAVAKKRLGQPPTSWAPRTLQLDVTDIAGASPGQKALRHGRGVGKTVRDSNLNVADINGRRYAPTHPQLPEVEGARPAHYGHTRVPEHTDYALRTTDIPGGSPRKWRTRDWLIPHERTQFRPLCNAADVPGAVPAGRAEAFQHRKTRAETAAVSSKQHSAAEREMEAALTSLMENVPPPQLRAAMKALKAADNDGSGLVTAAELSKSLRASAFPVREELQSMAPQLDTHGTGYVNARMLRDQMRRAATAPRPATVAASVPSLVEQEGAHSRPHTAAAAPEAHAGAASAAAADTSADAPAGGAAAAASDASAAPAAPGTPPRPAAPHARSAQYQRLAPPFPGFPAGLTRTEICSRMDHPGRRHYSPREEGAGRLLQRQPISEAHKWTPSREADHKVATCNWTRVESNEEGVGGEGEGGTLGGDAAQGGSAWWGAWELRGEVGATGTEAPMSPEAAARTLMAHQRAATAQPGMRFQGLPPPASPRPLLAPPGRTSSAGPPAAHQRVLRASLDGGATARDAAPRPFTAAASLPQQRAPPPAPAARGTRTQQRANAELQREIAMVRSLPNPPERRPR